MKNVKLKEVLKLEEVKEGIKVNLIEDFEEAIEKTISSDKENSISIIVNVDGVECDFENTLHADYEKNVFLLESRLFNRKDDSMINAYLELLDENLNVIEDYQDDVWEYANFKAV